MLFEIILRKSFECIVSYAENKIISVNKPNLTNIIVIVIKVLILYEHICCTLNNNAMPVLKLKNFLDENNVKYTTISHSKAFTAQQVAQSAHISGKDMVKTVIIFIDGKMAMAVLPAARHVDFRLLKDAIGIKNIVLAGEMDFKNLFPECEVGTMSPFGNLYDMDVYVDRSLAEDHEIAFNAGSHTELIQMAYEDFERLVNPKVIRFAMEESAV